MYCEKRESKKIKLDNKTMNKMGSGEIKNKM
jgi:hypothetical protein